MCLIELQAKAAKSLPDHTKPILKNLVLDTLDGAVLDIQWLKFKMEWSWLKLLPSSWLLFPLSNQEDYLYLPFSSDASTYIPSNVPVNLG